MFSLSFSVSPSRAQPTAIYLPPVFHPVTHSQRNAHQRLFHLEFQMQQTFRFQHLREFMFANAYVFAGTVNGGQNKIIVIVHGERADQNVFTAQHSFHAEQSSVRELVNVCHVMLGREKAFYG
jgi:hypothetical protein